MNSTEGVPKWLLADREAGMCACGCVGRRKKVSFLEKTIQDVARLLQDTVFSEALAARAGYLQNLDPRIKLVTFFALIGTAGLVHHTMVLILMYLGIVMLAGFTGIPLKGFVKRVWLVIPLFTGVMVLPSLLNFVRPGTPLVHLVDFGHPLHFSLWTLPSRLYITKQGAMGAALLIMRVGVSVSLALLLTSTTRWANLLKAMRVLFIPKIFIMVLEMTYRYIFLLLNMTLDMFMARKSRTVGSSDLKENRRFLAGAMGTLLAKSYNMSEEVYQAMVSRGYTGEARTLTNFRVKGKDINWSVLSLVLIILIVWGDRQLG